MKRFYYFLNGISAFLCVPLILVHCLPNQNVLILISSSVVLLYHISLFIMAAYRHHFISALTAELKTTDELDALLKTLETLHANTQEAAHAAPKDPAWIAFVRLVKWYVKVHLAQAVLLNFLLLFVHCLLTLLMLSHCFIVLQYKLRINKALLVAYNLTVCIVIALMSTVGSSIMLYQSSTRVPNLIESSIEINMSSLLQQYTLFRANCSASSPENMFSSSHVLQVLVASVCKALLGRFVYSSALISIIRNFWLSSIWHFMFVLVSAPSAYIVWRRTLLRRKQMREYSRVTQITRRALWKLAIILCVYVCYCSSMALLSLISCLDWNHIQLAWSDFFCWSIFGCTTSGTVRPQEPQYEFEFFSKAKRFGNASRLLFALPGSIVFILYGLSTHSIRVYKNWLPKRAENASKRKGALNNSNIRRVIFEE